MNAPLKFTFQLPDWARTFVAEKGRGLYSSDEDKVRVAIEAAALNVRHKTGGPFGAAVFSEAGDLVAVGVNLVEPEGSSILHAEVVALALAQSRAGTYSLHSESSGAEHTLASSAAPCVMCFGAIHWSGIRRLIFSAAKSDVEAIGFDEGPIPADWKEQLEAGGINVLGDCCGDAGRAVLQSYLQAGSNIYNASGRRKGS